MKMYLRKSINKAIDLLKEFENDYMVYWISENKHGIVTIKAMAICENKNYYYDEFVKLLNENLPLEYGDYAVQRCNIKKYSYLL